MKLISISTLLFLWMALTEAHPLHLSITNITYENGKLKINMKTFRDDWETAYFHYHGDVIDFSNPENMKIPWVSNYLNDHFAIARQKDEPTTGMTIDTTFITEDAIVIEIQKEVKGNPKSLYIYNTLLTDIFPDQTNLVIFGFKERETGIKFDVKKHDAVVKLK